MGKHTEGFVESSERMNGDWELLTSPQGDVIATFYGDDKDYLCLPVKENIRHVSALWNMAKELNLSTEAIEAGVVKDMMKAIKELLQGIEEIRRLYVTEDTTDYGNTRKALEIIQKAEGQEG